MAGRYTGVVAARVGRAARRATSPGSPSARKVAIIGAGPGGMCMAIKLKEAGYQDVLVLEKGSGVGGTWRHNRYPGAACDITSHLYSRFFEMKAD